jgi:hypothetical protein
VHLYEFLTLAIDEDEISDLFFIPFKTTSDIRCVGGWVDYKANMDSVEVKKICHK